VISKENHMNQTKRPFLKAAGAVAALAATGLMSAAQAAGYPDRAITMIVPFPPGGVADTVGRPVAEAMSRALGQPVVVENKAGAGGGIGMRAVSVAKPDGYTILMGLVSISTIPVADEVLGRPASFKLSQFTPIARITADPTVLAVRADSPWKTYKEFMDYVKANPNKINFGSSGNYGTMHVPMEMLKLETGTKMTHVPYKGAGPAVVGLLGGEIQALSTGPSSIGGHVKAGKIRVLAHWGASKLESMPDVPSLKSLGANVQFAQWSGVFAPAGTPEAAVKKLREAAKAAANDPKVKEAIMKAGSPIMYMDAPEFAKYWAADAKVLEGVVKKIGKVD
jgi:tripartite-type tricarboxylate transporter receptor subunit TctC